MVTAGIVAQVAPREEVDLGQLLFDSFVPRLVAFAIVLVIAVVLVRASRGRQRTGKPETAIPDWYPDPWGEPYQRWWNGAIWTPAVRPYPWPGPPTPVTPPTGPPTSMGPPHPGAGPSSGPGGPPGGGWPPN